MQQIRDWVKNERDQMQQQSKKSKKENQSTSVRPRLSSICLVANASLSLLNLACHLLDLQVKRLAEDFTNEGGFTERLYRVRKAKRMNEKGY